MSGITEIYWGPGQTSKMEHFAKIVNSFYPLTIFLKRSILDVWQGSEYTSLSWIKYSIKCLGKPLETCELCDQWRYEAELLVLDFSNIILGV